MDGAADRMKVGRRHRVPLSPQALVVLRKSHDLDNGTGLVFPSPTGRMLSSATLTKLLRESGVQAVPHGFRTSFPTWCGDAGVDREVAERALAHTVPGQGGSGLQPRDVVRAAAARHAGVGGLRHWGRRWQVEPNGPLKPPHPQLATPTVDIVIFTVYHI